MLKRRAHCRHRSMRHHRRNGLFFSLTLSSDGTPGTYSAAHRVTTDAVGSVAAVNLQRYGGELHPGNGTRPRWLANLVCKPAFPCAFDSTNRISRGHVWPAQVGNATGTTAAQPPMCTPSMRGETRVLAQGPSIREDGLPRCQAARIRLDVGAKRMPAGTSRRPRG
jgi:hypothetical protein